MRDWTRSLFAGLAALAVLAAAPAARAEGDAVALAWTAHGFVRGAEAGGILAFRGLRYAAAPVGARRWYPPQPPGFNPGVTDATAFAPHCPQAASFYGVASATEDCLFLNVYAPDRRAEPFRRGLPVMVWIHGGALVVGESDDYDPTQMVRQGNVIVVTINYRLGALGYLAHPALDGEDHRVANYGLMDQQAALRWVRQNIGFFGGDADRVTLFGQSAGALSTLSNLASPTARGLFARAIVESGAYSLKLPTLAAGEVQGTAFAAAAGCTDQTAACLRALPVSTILADEIQNVVPFVDGTLLTQSLDTAFASGAFNRVPVIDGSNHDEYRLFVGEDFDILGGAPITAQQYPLYVAGAFGASKGAAAVLAQYPLANYPSPDVAFATAVGDAAFACPARTADQLLSQFVPVWAYEFNDENAPEPYLPPASFPYAAAHASEMQFLFAVPRRPGTPALSGVEQQLSVQMIRYWTNFARAGHPNGDAAPHWPRYATSADVFQSLVPPSPMPEAGFAADHKCGFWTP